jgi:aerobic-type carbon monoxide dehydrogenase small subunit (CoxS/CutS family)
MEEKIRFTLNGKKTEITVDPDEPFYGCSGTGLG